MKKQLIPIFVLSALLAGCSAGEETGNALPDDAPVPILLGSGLSMETSTKAPVTTNAPFTAGIAGWETKGTPDYTAAPTWGGGDVTIDATASTSTAPSAVTWNPQQYYHADEDVDTYMIAWHPAGTWNAANNTVTFPNTDGSTDVLWASPIHGTKADKDDPQNLAFEHLTAQLNFQVVEGTGLAAGTTVQEITVQGVQVPTGLKIENGTLIAGAAADYAALTGGTGAITSTAAAVGNPLMIVPTDGNTLTVSVKTSGSADPLTGTVTLTENMQAGKAYTITLTFTQAAIDVTSTVAEWTTVPGGAGTIK